MHVRIHDDFVAMVRQNKLVPGGRLPTVRQVAKQYGVAVGTAALAFEALQSEGIIASRSRRGSFVAPTTQHVVATELILCIHPAFLHRTKATWRHFERLRGIMVAAQQRNAHLFPITDAGEFELYQHPGTRQGVILFDQNYEADGFAGVARYAVEHNMPICIVTGQGTTLPLVKDNRDAGFEQAVTHLLALGHRNVAFLNGPSGDGATATTPNVFGRIRQGYLRGLKRAGVPLDPQLYVEAGPPEFQGRAPTLEAMERLLSVDPRPTAILCNNDARALLVLDILKAHGIRVPEDISVVGCDDTPECVKSTPKLTSIATQLSGQGEEAVHYVVNRLLGQNAPAPSVTPQLVIRGSSGVPKLQVLSEGRALS